jgi:hypothetical protein
MRHRWHNASEPDLTMNRIQGRTAEDLEMEARAWRRADLIRIWNAIKTGMPIAGWPAGKAFEYLVVRAFEIEGARVLWPFQVIYPQKFGTMEQVDGVAYLGDRAFLLESKNLSEPMAVEAVARLRMRLESRPPGTMGVLFSVQNFTLPTEVFTQFATPLNVLLWESGDLDVALANASMVDSLRAKLDYATEHGLPILRLGMLT